MPKKAITIRVKCGIVINSETSHTVQFPTVFHDIGNDNELKVQGSIRIHATKPIYFTFIPISVKGFIHKNLMCIDTFRQH
jgi:hypothetical protein